MKVEPARVDAHIGVPGDKSISHRALLIGAICEGETRVSHWGRSGDTESTLGAVRALGVQVDEEDVETLVVHGAGLRGLQASDGPLDCGNAGTLARLISGILAFQEGRWSTATSRSPPTDGPDRRAARLMGAAIETTGGGLPV
jgi:3-phosphoshikimate 1-carboxyvinyltransferase